MGLKAGSAGNGSQPRAAHYGRAGSDTVQQNILPTGAAGAPVLDQLAGNLVTPSAAAGQRRVSPIRRAHLAFVPSWPRSARRAAPEFFRWDLIRSGTSDQAFASAHLIGIASRGASQSRRASHYAPGGQARRPRWSRSPQAVLAKSSLRLTGMMFCVGIGRPACDPRCRASP